MSAMTGICECSRSRQGFGVVGVGQATRTIWQPVAVSSAICCSVALTSVWVVVMDWTETGESPPTRTEPTRICLLLRRGASCGSGRRGIPRAMVTLTSLLRTARRCVASATHSSLSRTGLTMSAASVSREIPPNTMSTT